MWENKEELSKVTIRGYKSIQNLKNFELKKLNILIGANGAGKSNFISLFRLLAELASGNLQFFVNTQGGPDSFLRGGRRQTPEMGAEFFFGKNEYSVVLAATADKRMIFKDETVRFHGDKNPNYANTLGSAHEESRLQFSDTPFMNVECYVLSALKNWRVYHFHDTGPTAAAKLPHGSNDNLQLKMDAGNLAAYLAKLKNDPKYLPAYQRIVETIRLVAPFFGDFMIRDPLPDSIELEWTERSDPNTPYRAHLLSDGTLRFICLTTLLLQPIELLPATVLIDEPELGLHPYAINILASMIQQVAEQRQVILSTQSVELLNMFSPEDIIVVDRENGASTFKRLDAQALEIWLEDYTLGELWKSNILGGRPSR
jgi:predicted ATPase